MQPTQTMRALVAILLVASCPARLFAQSAATPGGGDSSFSVGVEPYGRSPYPLESTGLRLGYKTSPSRELLLTYIKAEETVLLSDFRLQEGEVRINQWFGPVVYLALGLGVRNVEMDYDVFVPGSTESSAVTERHQAVIAGVHLGVEFSVLEWLVIGSDLYGVTMPLKWLKHSSDAPDGLEGVEEDPKQNPYVSGGFKTCYQLFRTYLAVRF